jgi:hypothetical protein
MSYQVTMIQALPVLIVRAKALIAGRDARGPRYERLAPLRLNDVRMLDLVLDDYADGLTLKAPTASSGWLT